MPLPLILQLRGEPGYAEFLDRLAAEADRRGLAAPSRSALAEAALNRLAREWGIEPPRRSAPHGTNQHGERAPCP